MQRQPFGLALLALVTACVPADPPLRASTDHVDLLMHDEPPEGLADWLEHAVASYGEYLGVDERVRVAVMSTEDTRARCQHPAGSSGLRRLGCADGSTVYQNVTYFPHELVHAIASHLGTPPRALQEGLAQAIGCGTGQADPRTIEPDPALARWLADDDSFREGEWDEDVRARYDVAASFVRHVIDRFGRSALIELYRRLLPDRGAADVDAVFADVLGESADDVIARWVAEGVRPFSEICELVPECSLPTITGERWEVTLRPGLEQIAFSSSSFANRAGYAGVLELDTDSHVLAHFEEPIEPPQVMWIKLLGCSATWTARHSPIAAAPSGRLTWIPRGRYAVYAWGTADDAMPLPDTVHVIAHATPATDACEAVEVVLDDARPAISLMPDLFERPDDEYWYAISNDRERSAEIGRGLGRSGALATPRVAIAARSSSGRSSRSSPASP